LKGVKLLGEVFWKGFERWVGGGCLGFLGRGLDGGGGCKLIPDPDTLKK